jgi:hypothetical protein
MIELKKSRVVFNQEDHTYTLDGKRLQGVTGILERRLFPDKYKNIPEKILARAAQRGTRIHEMCELVDTLDVVPDDCQEATNYRELKKRLGLVAVDSEYLVSDNEHYASSIDVVYEGKDGVILNDRKTTSKLDLESVSWQLSIYALFFEMMNPDIKVEGLTATWLRGDICEYVDIERKPNDLVKALLEADINDEPFDYYTHDVPDFISDRLSEMSFLNTRIKALEAEQNALKKEVEKQMVERGIDNVKTPVATFTFVKPKKSTGFDQAAFKADNPSLFSKYTKETIKKGYLTIKFK